MSNLTNYPFPSLMEGGDIPIRNNGRFILGNQTMLVLDYLAKQDDFGWSDNLTLFHELEAGDSHFIDQASRANALRELRRYLNKPDAVILEVGCSSGYMLEDIQRTFPTAFVMGADVVQEPLEKLAEKMPSVPLMRFDLTQCPLSDNSVDAVVMLNVLEHIESDEQAMRHIARILKPGGVVIIEVPAGPGLYDIYDKMLMHFRRYTRKGLKKLMYKTGFRVRRASHLGCFLFPAFWGVKKYNRYKFNDVGMENMQQKVAKKNTYNP